MANQKTEVLNAQRATAEVVESYDAIGRSVGNIGRTFVGTDTNISIKSEYNRVDYDWYRRGEVVPSTIEGQIALAMRAYDKVGIVRNIIDLMSDFVCKGIRIVHTNAQQQRFYQEWFDYVNGDNVSERFTNYLYRIANVPVVTTYGKVPTRIERKWSSAYGIDQSVVETKVESRRIPLRYSFINPLTLEPLAPEITMFTGKSLYALRISVALRSAIARLQYKFPSLVQEEIIKLLPDYLISAIKNNNNLLPINSDNIQIYQYKKDDWDVWAKPMVSAILDDLIMLDKMKLADVSALDGAISNIRLWKLGNIGTGIHDTIIPTEAMISKLRNILANNVGGGTVDLVWGPDLDFKESSTQVHHFLGAEKYQPVLSNIYEGLGIPFTMSGGGGKGMTNNYISMQTFVERLEYGRRVLLDFWNHEIKKVQLAMGYSKPAQVVFDQINLGDDNTYKTLLIQLLDRDVISLDTVLNSFGLLSEVEKVKIRKEYTGRDSKKIPNKTSPFHQPQTEHDLKKIILQRGGVAPSEVGLNLLPKKEGELSPNEQQEQTQLKLADKNAAKLEQQKYAPSNLDNGRPKFAKDTTKRKQKTPPLQTKADNFVNRYIWANDAQRKISEIVTPIFLKQIANKSNVRKLTNDEVERLEYMKFIALGNIEPYSDITPDILLPVFSSALENNDIIAAAKTLKFTFQQQNKREPNTDEMRQIQAAAFSLAYEPEESTESEFEIMQK